MIFSFWFKCTSVCKLTDLWQLPGDKKNLVKKERKNHMNRNLVSARGRG
jgi:hypothetical protein